MLVKKKKKKSNREVNPVSPVAENTETLETLQVTDTDVHTRTRTWITKSLQTTTDTGFTTTVLHVYYSVLLLCVSV